MKLKSIFYGILGLFLCVACADDEKITPGNEGLKLRFEFPQGENEWDKIAQEIQEKYDVYLIYKDIDSMHLRRTWTNGNSKYAGESLTDDQAALHLHFMKEHIFAYLSPEVTKQALPVYFYLVSSYRNSTAATSYMMNTTNGVDFWVNSIFSKTKPTISTWKEYWGCRYMLMKCILESLVNHGNVVASKEFHKMFDYTTPFIRYGAGSEIHHPWKRGFVTVASGDHPNTSDPYYIYDTNEKLNFISYIYLGMLYSLPELEAKFPEKDYATIHKARNYIVKYMKEKYKIDLEAIYQGPEI